MIGQMAFPGFNELGHSVTPVLLLIDPFLDIFSTLSEKMKKNLSTKSLFVIVKYTIKFSSFYLFVYLRFQIIPIKGLNYVKMMVTFG